MAAPAAKKLGAEKNFILTSNEFESSVKMRLKWNKKQWSEEGESGNRVNKLCNSLNYWEKKLKPAMEDVSFVFTIFNTEKDTRFNLINVVEEIESLNTEIKVMGFTEFRNPRYLCMHFKNEEEKNFIKCNFKMCENSFVVPLSWASAKDDDTLTLRVHWIPITVDINVIKTELEKYVTCISEERNNFNFLSGRNMPMGKVSFKVLLKKDVKAEDVPHVTNINNLEALITMPGRLPLCLGCGHLGHISRNCKLRFCSICNKMKPREHPCSASTDSRSFADVVRKRNNEIDPDDWGEGDSFTKEELFKKEKVALEQQISRIEFKLKNGQEESAEHIAVRQEMKRKAQSDTKNESVKVVDESANSVTAFEQMNTAWSDDQEYLSSENEGSEGEKAIAMFESPSKFKTKVAKFKEDKSLTTIIDKMEVKKNNKTKGYITDIPGGSSTRSTTRKKESKGSKSKEQLRQEKLEGKVTREFLFTD